MRIDADEPEPVKPELPKPEPAKPVATTVPTEPAEPAVYKAGQADASLGDWSKSYYPRVAEYANSRGYFVVPSIADAIKQRSDGKKVLTIREADTACRGMIQLDSPMLMAAMQTYDGIIIEDYVGGKTSVYELRNICNQKIKFLQGSPPLQDAMTAQKQLRKIFWALSAVKLGPYVEEEKVGFHADLCKPDFMTWDQYYNKMKNDPEPSLHNWEEILKDYDNQHVQ